MTKSEIRAKLKQTIKACKKNSYFLFDKDFDLNSIPEIIKNMYDISGLLHAIPTDGEYEDRLCGAGYFCTYNNCPVPEDLIPKIKDEHKDREYAVNASFNAYAMYIRDFTHDLNSTLYAFKEFYNRHQENSWSYPKEFIHEYALYLQPFLCTVLSCAEYLLNGDEYEGEPLYYSRYNKKEEMYKTYYLRFDCVTWQDKKFYVYRVPILRKDQITQKFVWKTRNTFERVTE